MTHERTDTLRLPADVNRLVVLGDPHGDLIGLELVLAKEGKPGTAFASAGDNVGYADGKVLSFMCQLLEERKTLRVTIQRMHEKADELLGSVPSFLRVQA